MKLNILSLGLWSMCCFALLANCVQKNTAKTNVEKPQYVMSIHNQLDTITLGGGCFWCTEAIFQRLKGVLSVTSGYSGGETKNPSYEEICSGTTNHAECVQVAYNRNEISLTEILEVFFKTHDPTTLNKQGADEGTQYRSVVFYNNEEQRKATEEIIQGLDKSGAFSAPIVTELAAISVFYKAEDYHQNYYNENKSKNSYCAIVIVPKIEKFEKYFANRLKK